MQDMVSDAVVLTSELTYHTVNEQLFATVSFLACPRVAQKNKSRPRVKRCLGPPAGKVILPQRYALSVGEGKKARWSSKQI